MDAPPGFFDSDDSHLDALKSEFGIDPAATERAQRVHEWKRRNAAKFGVRKEFTAASSAAKKDAVPPEFMRRVMKQHGNLQGKRFREERRLLLGAMQYMPLALAKLLESMPMPWEATKYVNVVQHVSGAITIVDDTPVTCEPLHTARWGAMWTSMRRKKAATNNAGGVFRRMAVPAFDDNEPPIDFVEHLMDAEGSAPIVDVGLDPEDDRSIIDWFFDAEPVLADPNRISRRRGQWFFTVDVIESLYRAAAPILPDFVDENRFYLWDLPSFYCAKAMHVAIPRAPKFDILRRRGRAGERLAAADDEDWTEFNAPRRTIFRNDDRPMFAMLTERQIAFPFLYSREIDGVQQGPYHHSARAVVEDSGLPTTFNFSVDLNPIRPVPCDVTTEAIHAFPPESQTLRSQLLTADGADAFLDDDMPLLIATEDDEALEPFLADIPIEHELTRTAIGLVFAPAPFNTFSGTMRRTVDIALAESYYEEPPALLNSQMKQKVIDSYTKLLKHHVLKRLEHTKAKKTGSSKRRLDILKGKNFQHSKIEWLEAALQTMRQGHGMLVQLVQMKGLACVHVDYNFNAKPTRTLTTKEIKKSRLGPAFHIVREMLTMMKHITDAHVKFRLEQIDGYQLADALHYIFTHNGKLTGLYRYKHRAMRQLKRSRDLKHMLYERFNVGAVPRGPGMGFWAPAWRMWVFYFRGMTPLLQRYVQNLVNRMFEGRKHKLTTKKITKQRIESDRDVNIKEDFRRELRELLPSDARGGVIETLDQHLNESFRCWKANRPWIVPDMAAPLRAVIEKYTKLRAEEFTRYAHAQRKRIDEGLTVDKQAFMKNLGKLTRLKMMSEAQRQFDFITGAEAPHVQLNPADASSVLECVASWLRDRGFRKIQMPKTSHPASNELLRLSLSRLRVQHNILNRLTQEQREEQKRIEEALDAPYECLTRIRDALSRQRHFKTIKVTYMDEYAQLYPVYTIDPWEKMVDAYLDQYLWFEAMNGQQLFPNWVKPSDAEPLPVLVHKWCQGINNFPDVWSTANGESNVMLKLDLGVGMYDNVNWTLFRSLLELIMDPVLAEYIVARHNVRIDFKDMGYDHAKGLIRGVMFSGFLAQYWGLVMDILLIGKDRSQELAGPPTRPNPFLSFARNPTVASTHPIRGYSRYKNTSHVFLRYTKAEADELRQRYLEATKDDPEVAELHRSVYGFPNFREWPRDARMNLFLGDVNLARAALWDFQSRIPPSFLEMSSDGCRASVYSVNNSNLLFDLGGFSIRILPVCRTLEHVVETQSTWPLYSEATRDMTARAFVQVSPTDVVVIKNRVRRCIMMVGSSTFQNIATKWNSLLTEIVPYYREAILGTKGLQEVLAYAERRMQTRIMMSLNSKAAARFPAVMFYSPTDMGGLGMMSVGHSLIQASNGESGAQYFYSGLQNVDNQPIPNILTDVYPPWETEIAEHVKAMQEYGRILAASKQSGARIALDDIQDLLDKGIPRISVFFSKEAKLFKCDKGFRTRLEFQKYSSGKPLKNWWFNPDHDGRLGGSTERYRADMIIALGGVEAILEHSLFRGTGFPSWEGLDWNTSNAFENSKRDANITKAMRGGLTLIPNRRFALWWSPTINRSEVFAGTERQLDLTGVFFFGKLETIKKSLIKLFANGFWSKIHTSIVDTLVSAFNRHCRDLGAEQVIKASNHPNKSFTYASSAPDLILFSEGEWSVDEAPSLHSERLQRSQNARKRVVKKWWIDVQLRWGNFDSHNAAELARARYNQYNRDGRSYPSPAGVVVVVDLAYNIFAAYGVWIDTSTDSDLKELLPSLLNAVVQNDAMLKSLRMKLCSELQLRSSQPTEQNLTTTNISEMFSTTSRTWIVDDSHAYVTSEQPTPDGSKKFKSENGAVIVFEPRSGALRFSVIHKSVFAGHKRRTKLAKEKAAEEIVTWLRSTDEKEHPNEIVVTRPKFRAVVQNMLTDWPNIKVRSTDLSLALPSILLHSRLAEYRVNATENRCHLFNAYDDWLHMSSPFVCFNRLNYILRAYHVNLQRTREMLEPDTFVEKRPGHFWPTLAREEWKTRCLQLHELIIADYCRRNNIAVGQLLTTEMQDIVLGKKMTNQEIQAEEAKEIEERHKAAVAASKDAAETTTTTVANKRGELVKRRVKVAFSASSASSITEWRPRCVADAALHQRMDKIYVVSDDATAKSTQLTFPKDSLARLIQVCDVQVEMLVYLFGQVVPQSPEVREVLAFMIPPQSGGLHHCETPERVPFDCGALVDNNLVFLGTMRLGGGSPAMHTKNLAHHGRIVARNDGLQQMCNEAGVTTLTTTIVSLQDGTLTLETFETTLEGAAWAAASFERVLDPRHEPAEVNSQFTQPCRAKVSDRLQAFFLVPVDVPWNAVFGRRPQGRDVYDVAVGQPAEYFSAAHHPADFLRFTDKTEDVEEVGVDLQDTAEW